MDDSSSNESDNEGFLQLHNKTTSYCINYLGEQEVTLQVVENDPSNGSNGSNGIILQWIKKFLSHSRYGG